MKRILEVLKAFFISLYNFLVGLPEAYDVEVRNLYDKELGEGCNEYGTLFVRPCQKALYNYVIRSCDEKREKYGNDELKISLKSHIVTIFHDKEPILHGKAVKADDGSFMIKGPGYFKTKTLEANDLLFFERIWDMPFDV